MPDLKLLADAPSAHERVAIDAVVGEEAANGDRVARSDRTRRHLLLPALRAAQRRVGWVSPGALGYASRAEFLEDYRRRTGFVRATYKELLA